MGLSLHIEPYPERSPKTFEEDVDYIIEKYGRDLSLLDLPTGGKEVEGDVETVSDPEVNGGV